MYHGRTVHFIGFRGEEYNTASRVYGKPDYIHKNWDRRARREIDFDADVLVFANAATPDVLVRNAPDINEDLYNG